MAWIPNTLFLHFRCTFSTFDHFSVWDVGAHRMRRLSVAFPSAPRGHEKPCSINVHLGGRRWPPVEVLPGSSEPWACKPGATRVGLLAQLSSRAAPAQRRPPGLGSFCEGQGKDSSAAPPRRLQLGLPPGHSPSCCFPLFSTSEKATAPHSTNSARRDRSRTQLAKLAAVGQGSLKTSDNNKDQEAKSSRGREVGGRQPPPAKGCFLAVRIITGKLLPSSLVPSFFNLINSFSQDLRRLQRSA